MIFLKFRINKKSSFGQELITQSSYFFIAKHNCDGTNWIWGWSELNLIVHNTEFGWLIQFLSLFNRIFYPESFLVRLLLKFVSVNWSNSICTVHSIWKKSILCLYIIRTQISFQFWGPCFALTMCFIESLLLLLNLVKKKNIYFSCGQFWSAGYTIVSQYNGAQLFVSLY